MKAPAVWLLGLLPLLAFEQKTQIAAGYNFYDPYGNEAVTFGRSELAFENGYFRTNAAVEYLYSGEYADRRYVLLNELYVSKDIGDYRFVLGKKIEFWGETEGFSFADIYNHRNYLYDPFDKDAKYGSVGASVSRFFDEDTLTLGLKLYEADIPYPEAGEPYHPFPFDYDAGAHFSLSRYSPSVYLSYEHVFSGAVDAQTRLILWHGYDNKRIFLPVGPDTLAQYAYRCGKAMLLADAVYEDYIFKTEMTYTDVIDEPRVSDYAQFSFGLERSFYDIAGTDVTLYGEYYHYHYADGGKTENVDIAELYDNDVFGAVRIAFNDTGDSSLKAGVLADVKNGERFYRAEASGRLFERFVARAEYLCLTAARSDATPMTYIGDTRRFGLSVAYTF